jgi:hypothetical protein
VDARHHRSAVRVVRLSDRQQAALLALADLGVPVTGSQLAEGMRVYRPQTSVSAAHQAANGLDNKGVALKLYAKGSAVRYEVTDKGRELATRLRAAS